MKITELTPRKTSLASIREETILEKVNRMPLEELNEYDIFIPKDQKHYNGLQANWLKEEIELIRNRPGHSQEVTDTELVHDAQKYHNFERYRAFYVLSYPDKVTK
jgi:hypothetical protein